MNICTFSLTQYKLPFELEVGSKCFSQKALFSLMLQPTDQNPATWSEKNWQRYLAEKVPKF